jgi:hypothetical protein
MSRSTSRQDLPLRRDDFNTVHHAVGHSGWHGLLAHVLTFLKRRGFLSRDVRKGEDGGTICVLPHDAGHRVSATPSDSDIYGLVVATFSELGMPTPIDVCETLYVTHGFFIGHKFRCDGGYALWGAGWNTVEFYDEGGKLLKMVSVKKAFLAARRYKPAA